MNLRLFLGIILLTGGLIAGPWELYEARYVAGEIRSEGTVFARNTPAAPLELDVSEEDFPLRVNLVIRGEMDRIGTIFGVGIVVTNGLSEADQRAARIMFDEENITSDSTWKVGGILITTSGRAAQTQKTFFFDNGATGRWTLSVTPHDEQNFETSSIDASVITNARAIDWTIAGPGLLALLLGAIIIAARFNRHGKDIDWTNDAD